MFIQKYIFFAFRFDKCKYIGLVNSRYFYEKPIQKVNITFYPSDQTDHIYYCYIILSHTWKSHWHREENSWVVFGWYWVQSLEVPELERIFLHFINFTSLPGERGEIVGSPPPPPGERWMPSVLPRLRSPGIRSHFYSENSNYISLPLLSLLSQLLPQWPLLSGDELVTLHLF